MRRGAVLVLLPALMGAGEAPPTFKGFLPDPPLTARAHQAAAACIWNRNPVQARASVSDYVERPHRGAMSKLKEMYPTCEQEGDPSNNIDPDRLAGALAELMLPADPLSTPVKTPVLPIDTQGGEDDLRFARCALAVAPAESLGVLRTDPGSAEERDAMQRWIPALTPCAPERLGEFDRRLPRGFVRTQLALALFAHVNNLDPGG